MSSSARRLAHLDDPVLAAAARAPLVPLNEEEQALLSELDSRPVRWIPTEEFVAKLGPNDERG